MTIARGENLFGKYGWYPDCHSYSDDENKPVLAGMNISSTATMADSHHDTTFNDYSQNITMSEEEFSGLAATTSSILQQLASENFVPEVFETTEQVEKNLGMDSEPDMLTHDPSTRDNPAPGPWDIDMSALTELSSSSIGTESFPSDQQNIDKRPFMSLTPFSAFSAHLRAVATTQSHHPSKGSSSQDEHSPEKPSRALADLLGILGCPPPAPPPLGPNFRTGGGRYPRDVELKVPAIARLAGIVYSERLGDIAEEIAFTHLSTQIAQSTTAVGKGLQKDVVSRTPASQAPKQSSRKQALNTTLTQNRAQETPIRGPLEAITQQSLAPELQEQVRCALRAMEHVKQSSREADYEYTYRRVIGDILMAAFRHIGVHDFYIRHGSSAAGVSVVEGQGLPGSRAIPDLESVLKQTVLNAIEIKTEQSLMADLCFTLLDVAHGEDAYLAEQLEKEPNFVSRFIWPGSSTQFLTSETALIVQVWTAMVMKGLCIMEATCGGSTSFFVWRRSLRSKVLYISRPYVRADTSSCASLTRFAFTYLAIKGLLEDLGEKIGLENDPPRHTSGRQHTPGVDTSTTWMQYRNSNRNDPPKLVSPPRGRLEFRDRVKGYRRRMANEGVGDRVLVIGQRGRPRNQPVLYAD